MCGPAFDPIATLALPTAKIAVMGADAAVNAVYANRIAAFDDAAERQRFITERREEYEADVDLLRLAAEMVVDAIVPFERLREELIGRFATADPVDRDAVAKRHGVPPV
jgi:acetyl-CoA carboxylase carboxyltransferase component